MRKKTKIRGLQILLADNFTIVYNAYQIKDIKKIEEILSSIFQKKELSVSEDFFENTIKKWKTQHVLYKMKIFPKKNKNLKIFDEKKYSFFEKMSFYIFSGFALRKRKEKRLQKRIKKQEKRFQKSLDKHQRLIYEAYQEMIRCPYLTDILDIQMQEKLKSRIEVHDLSKTKEPEYTAYRKYFYPISKKEKKEAKSDFLIALQHHYENNPHHWQNRKNISTFSKNNDEQVLNVLENICDWLARGYEFHNRPYQYYEEHKTEIILCSEERAFLEKIIYEGVDRPFITYNNEIRSDKQ